MIITAPRATSIIYNYLKTNSKGGYYVLPVNICPIIPLAFLKAEVDFEFVDISDESLCISYNEIVKHLENEECEGMVFVYTYGISTDANSLFKKVKAKRNNFIIIEDKCLSVPSFSLGEASPNASFTLYSTGNAKYCELGYGGFAVSHELFEYQIHDTVYRQRDLVSITLQYKEALKRKVPFKYNIEVEWLDNSKCTWTLDEYRKKVDKEIRAIRSIKESINSIYEQSIPKHLWLAEKSSSFNSWRFQLRIPARNKLLTKIFCLSLFASAHYECLDRIFPTSFKSFDVARKLENEVLNLFNNRKFSVNQALKICNVINEHVSNIK